jgi:2-polyprenyl-6-methoxyphenol hydroxylase-like FAD-dependent oxidoreductase
VRVVVIGGGLAGMVAAREIAQRGHDVLLVEKTTRLGGKAGSDIQGGRNVEHGYHVFPNWYPNTRAILREIGAELVDFDRYHYLVRGDFPDFVTVRGPTDLASILHNVRRGLLPWYQTILFFAFTLDMISRPLSEKRLLDHVSQIGLMRDRWYVTEEVAELNQENLLKASAIPAYDMSAMTAKKIGGFWLREASPFLSVLAGDLQERFIDPLAAKVREAGVEIRLEATVIGLDVDGGSVSAARLADGGRITGDAFVLATPFEVARRFVDGPLFDLDPSLGDMHWLEAQPMAALHLRLKKKLPGLPREHVFFHGGDYGLSFIDLAQIWDDHPVPTELSFIASNFTPLQSLSAADATARLLGEIRAYLPFDLADLAEPPILNPNVDVPLFINTIGAWPNRPAPKSRAPNLYLAGDHVKNAVDLACMEGAIHSALQAARELLRDAGATSLPAIAEPKVWPRSLLLLARVAMSPIVLFAAIVARAAGVVRGSGGGAR